jgi:hypothetical protein
VNILANITSTLGRGGAHGHAGDQQHVDDRPERRGKRDVVPTEGEHLSQFKNHISVFVRFLYELPFTI